MKRKKGAPPKKIENNFQPIAPERAWHPRRGAPLGNRNAQTTGAHERDIQAMRRYARLLIRGSHAALAAFYAERERWLADLRPPP
jgi:hypothetical protein